MTPVAGALLIAGAMIGCGGDHVTNSMSPRQARAQVVDAGRELTRDLGLQRGDVVEAAFSYESCTDDNKGPYRGRLAMQFWMPGGDRSQPVDPATVYTRLAQHDWRSDPDWHTHTTAMQKDGVVAEVNVYAAEPSPVAHVGVVLRGECRDTSDHSKDSSHRDDPTAELQPE